MLKELLQINSQINYVGLSGIIESKFYHVVFIAMEMKYKAFAIFENGDHVEIKDSKGKTAKYSFFDYNGKRYVINTQDHLWFQGNIVNAVNAEGIKNFLENKMKEPNIVYDAIKTKISNYYDFINLNELDIVVCHIIHSYLLGLLGKTFYLLLDGERNTGKSTLQNLMAKLHYHGCFGGKSSIASIVRKIHYLRASVNLDEFEKLDKDEKSVMTGILNTGAYASGTKEIVNLDNKGSSNQIQIFRTFGTKTFSVNKASFDESFISRAILINTVRNTKKVKSIYALTEDERSSFQNLTNDIFCICLKYGREIIKEIECKQLRLEDKGVYGRRSDILAIICGIKSYFTIDDADLFEYLISKEELDEEDCTDNDRLYHALKYLSNLLKNSEEHILEFSNEDLRNFVIQGLEIDVFDQYAPTAKSIGSLLKRSKLICDKKDRKRRGGKGNTLYLIPRERIRDIIERSGFKDLIGSIAETKFTSSQSLLIQ
ncbi:MAG: hypothetical protein UR28_C0028G0020 [Candidatus Peregrinibacteria bacterium GW2011_GWF2_33_10]|nr:MAG: hypothetical protein UR28_C0028G0020 [Candidatus Peregrinibacteria bacterium GW2011_GWF2_33_10]OGJ45854.1 MAG: hypothetical protein A2263_03620 [Candidatus Peregrinibacteria bacterium RIFOXYA2_FULL_33_21]OGJ51354.1 MAG: hypothetical protein A2307_02275 [Candidatus Peregrinibacteria bacterium RIFOXYB2_FULL_33_20]